jgi:hypothetical protein
LLARPSCHAEVGRRRKLYAKAILFANGCAVLCIIDRLIFVQENRFDTGRFENLQPSRCGLISITVIVRDAFKLKKRGELFVGISDERCPHSIKQFWGSRIGPKASLPSCSVLTQTASMRQEQHKRNPNKMKAITMRIQKFSRHTAAA